MKRDLKLPLSSFDDMFTTQAERDDAKLERIRQIPLAELYPFQNHPFKVRKDKEMKKMIDSICQYGVLTPAIARPREGGGYELVSGHRRLLACKDLMIETLPVVVREMTDDEAVISMVDANLSREYILPSEKAFAYRMKLDAMNRQGQRTDLTSVQLGQKLAREVVAEESGESQTQIQRYIRLTSLIPELLLMVDDRKIAFNPAVELSYLTPAEQKTLLTEMQAQDCTPSHAQAIRLKKLSQEGNLSPAALTKILSEEKPNQVQHYKFKSEDIRKYFPKNYIDEQVCDAVIKILEQNAARTRKSKIQDSR